MADKRKVRIDVCGSSQPHQLRVLHGRQRGPIIPLRRLAAVRRYVQSVSSSSGNTFAESRSADWHLLRSEYGCNAMQCDAMQRSAMYGNAMRCNVM